MGHRENVFINGVKACSVTQAIGIIDKPFLKMWYGKNGTAKCQQIMRESSDFGSHVHEGIECYFRGEELPDLSPQEAATFSLLKGWALNSRFNPHELEAYLESQQHGYYGTCDAIGELDGKLFVLDWKTSKQIDDTYGLQLAAYAAAYKETTGTEITEGIIVRADKKADGKNPLEVRVFHDLQGKYFPAFLHALGLWKFVNQK